MAKEREKERERERERDGLGRLGEGRGCLYRRGVSFIAPDGFRLRFDQPFVSTRRDHSRLWPNFDHFEQPRWNSGNGLRSPFSSQ